MNMGYVIGFIIVVILLAAGGLTVAFITSMQRKADEKLNSKLELMKVDGALSIIIEEALVHPKFKGRALDVLTEIEMLKKDMENEL